jgi:hypothetical protein
MAILVTVSKMSFLEPVNLCVFIILFFTPASAARCGRKMNISWFCECVCYYCSTYKD